jgi:PTS system nitrogen regulatory IIA component
LHHGGQHSTGQQQQHSSPPVAAFAAMGPGETLPSEEQRKERNAVRIVCIVLTAAWADLLMCDCWPIRAEGRLSCAPPQIATASEVAPGSRCSYSPALRHPAKHAGRGPGVQLTIKQAAELLRVSESQVHRWIRDRGLPAILFNEQYRLNRVSLMDWAQRNQIPMPITSAEEARPFRIAEALARGGIHRGVPGTTRLEVVAAAVDRLSLPPGVDRELLREMVLARTAHDSAAIGGGIALPHARYPFVADLPEPVLGLCFPAAPIDFGAADRVPITALFVLVSPTVRMHLHVLSRLARALTGGLQQPVHAQAADAEILAAAATCDAAAKEPRA